jgi:hypothetical protein
MEPPHVESLLEYEERGGFIIENSLLPSNCLSLKNIPHDLFLSHQWLHMQNIPLVINDYLAERISLQSLDAQIAVRITVFLPRNPDASRTPLLPYKALQHIETTLMKNIMTFLHNISLTSIHVMQQHHPSSPHFSVTISVTSIKD